MTGDNIMVELDGKTYRVRYSVQKGSKEGGLSPDIPDYIDHMQVWRVEEVPVDDEETVNRICDYITENYLRG